MAIYDIFMSIKIDVLSNCICDCHHIMLLVLLYEFYYTSSFNLSFEINVKFTFFQEEIVSPDHNSYPPIQDCPSPLNPVAQIQTNEPGVFVHEALVLHGLETHSSISVRHLRQQS